MFKSLITLTSSISELRKDFLDRKKVLKSSEANSLIYRENVVLPAQDDVHRAPNARLASEQNKIVRFSMFFSFFVDLGSELSSEGYPKMSDDRDIAEKVVSWTLLSAVKISGQSMKI